MEAVIDTNVFLFDTFEDSESHDEAVATLDSMDGGIFPALYFTS